MMSTSGKEDVLDDVGESVGVRLLALEADLRSTSTWIMVVLLVILAIVPLTITIGISLAGEILIGLILGVASALFVFLLVVLEIERAVDRRFERHTRGELEKLAEESGLTNAELAALAMELVPSPEKLRKRILKDNSAISENGDTVGSSKD